MPSQVLTRQNADSTQLTELRTAALAQLADDIRALLAERDGLRQRLGEIDRGGLVPTSTAVDWQHRAEAGEAVNQQTAKHVDALTVALSASNAALADALRLLERWYFAAVDKTLGPFSETAALIAKHGKTEEAKL